ncbi:E3 ubiquitin-protein ligase SIS3-like [Durio zibethinus]|uniref:RING-type E3 ubiquitin transferase n=1 Tax=Durio zibethinus TaxID=66656 RepID=A0A6P6A3U3_DURZI|nr:E3 ubiquitin-protein ligase SIS3-like [Durio zibethinus]
MLELYNVWQQDEGVYYEPDQEVQAFQQVRFSIQIHRLLKDNNGRVRERVVEFQDDGFWIRSELFSSVDLFVYIAGCLNQAGIHSLDIEQVLIGTFSEITLILNKEENSKVCVVPIMLCVYKWERWEDAAEAEDMAVEEAMAATALKPVPATKESIQALRKVKLGDIPCVSREICVICLEELSLQAMDLTSMPCAHLFHGNCIVKWLNTSHLCPLCRFPMPTCANQ